MAETPKPANVYAKIATVQGELAKVGISKSRRNQQGSGYNFRGIDEVYNTLSPIMAEHGLCILPRIISRDSTERTTKAGGVMFYVTVEAEFDFVSADDGSIHTVRTFGEAMDTSDKATNKAMSAAYKYAALMTFAIPTEGDNDADAHTPEVVSKPTPLSDGDWAKIVSLVQATKTNTTDLKRDVGVDNLKLMTPDQFAKAVDMLETRLQTLAKTAPPADDLGGDEIPY